MLDFILYCDLSTINLSSDEITDIIKSFSKSYIQLSSNTWIFKYPDGYTGSQFFKEEEIYLNYFKKHITDETEIMISRITNHAYLTDGRINDFLD